VLVEKEQKNLKQMKQRKKIYNVAEVKKMMIVLKNITKTVKIILLEKLKYVY